MISKNFIVLRLTKKHNQWKVNKNNDLIDTRLLLLVKNFGEVYFVIWSSF